MRTGLTQLELTTWQSSSRGGVGRHELGHDVGWRSLTNRAVVSPTPEPTEPLSVSSPFPPPVHIPLPVFMLDALRSWRLA